MKNIFLFFLFLFSFVVSAQCEINIGEPTKPNCGSGIVPILHKREVTLYSVVDCDKYVYEKDVVLDVLTIDFQTGLATSIAGIFQYVAGQITLIDPCPVECFIVCSRVSYKCGNNILWSAYKCSQEYAGVPVVNTPPTTTINPPTGTILPAPTNDDGGCAGGFISEVVELSGVVNSPIILTGFPINICALLKLEAIPSGSTSLNITSTVTTSCGTDVDTYILPITENGGGIESVNGLMCNTPTPTTVINPPVNGILPAPTNNDNGCVGGITFEEVTITSGILNLTITSFPADLPALLCGQPHDGSLTSIVSTVTSDCGTDIDTLELNILVQGGVVTEVDGVACQLPPTTTINPLIGTILPAPTNDDGGCAGGFTDEKLRINWDGIFIDLPINGAPYDLCDYLLGQPINVLEPTPMTINSSVTTNCGFATDQINITVLQSGGFITGVNGVSCTPSDLYDCFEISISNNFFDRWRIDGGADIMFPSGNTAMGGVMNEMISTLPQTDVIGISVNPLSSKNFILSSNTGTISLVEIYNTVLSVWEQFTITYTGQASPCTVAPCLEITPSMVVGGNNVCASPYGYRTNISVLDASAPLANINSISVNYEVRDQDGNIIVSPTNIIPAGSPAGSSSAILPDILGTHRYVITEEVEDINGCVAAYYGYNTVSLRINCLLPTPRSTDVNSALFTECGASGGLCSSLASMDGDTSYDLLMLEGFSGVSASQITSQNITITNQTTGESTTYVLTGEWQNIFYDTEAQILADFPSGLNSGDVIEISGTVTFANGCTTPVQTGTNTLP